MTIKKEKYLIASKCFPLVFYTKYGSEVDDFEEALFDDKDFLKETLNTFDDKDAYQILKVEVKYEF